MKFLSTTLLVLSASSAFCFQASPINVPSTSLQSSTKLYMADEKRRVVVTGLGVISGCGTNPDDFFQACLEGKSSLGKVQRFDASAYPCQIASEVHDFNPEDYFLNPKNVKSNDRFTHFAVASARMALKDAGLGDTPETLQNADRVGVMVGTAFGGAETFEQETLKLAKKPERPKVSTFDLSFPR
jgi:3-oxoacyl-[acyl-carrier-protein] synthase II